MLKKLKFLSLIVVIACTFALASCSRGSSVDDRPGYSAIGIIVDMNGHVAPQNFDIDAGKLPSWRLDILVTASSDTHTLVGLAVERIDETSSAAGLRTSNRVWVADCYQNDCHTTRTLKVRLIPGQYRLTTDGALTGVVIHVTRKTATPSQK